MPLSPSLAVSDWPSSCTKIMDSHSSTTSFFVAQFSNALQRGGVTSANTESRPLQDQGTLAEEVFAAQPALCQPTVQLCMTCSSGLLWLCLRVCRREQSCKGWTAQLTQGTQVAQRSAASKAANGKKKKKNQSFLLFGQPWLMVFQAHYWFCTQNITSAFKLLLSVEGPQFLRRQWSS